MMRDDADTIMYCTIIIIIVVICRRSSTISWCTGSRLLTFSFICNICCWTLCSLRIYIFTSIWREKRLCACLVDRCQWWQDRTITTSFILNVICKTCVVFYLQILCKGFTSKMHVVWYSNCLYTCLGSFELRNGEHFALGVLDRCRCI